MSDSTPGPWRWREPGQVGNTLAFRLKELTGPDDQRICNFGLLDTFDLLHEAGFEPNDADAALIVAAPDLLAACEAALAELNGNCDEITERTIAQLEDAIAKATAQTPAGP